MPISCHLYDQLERATIQKKTVRLKFDSSASHNEFEGVITDLISRKGCEFLKAKNGQEWPLSGLVSIETIQNE